MKLLNGMDSKDLFKPEAGLTKIGQEIFYNKQTTRNDMIRLPYKMTSNQLKLMTYILSLIDPRKSYENQVPIVTSTDKLRVILGWSKKTEWSHLRKELLKMRRKAEVTITEADGTMNYSVVFPTIKKHPDGMIEIIPNPELKQYMFELENAFTNIKLKIITAFKSFYSMRLYQILLSWLDDKHGIRKTPQYFSFEQLKTILNVSEKYDWYEFNRRILTPAVAEINNLGDITIEWERHVGYKNKTTGVSFMYGYDAVWKTKKEGRLK